MPLSEAEQLVAEHGDACLPAIRQRAALPEAAAQSLPIHHLAPRPGAAEAATEFDVLHRIIVHGEAPPDDAETGTEAMDNRPAETPPVEPTEPPAAVHRIDLTVDDGDRASWSSPAAAPPAG